MIESNEAAFQPHLNGYKGFMRSATIGTVLVVVILGLMALFLL